MAITLEQKRAAYAWQCSVTGQQKAPGEYGRLAKSTPMMMMSSGLMQTLAFLREKNGVAHELILNDIINWLTKQFDGEATSSDQNPFPERKPDGYRDMMQALFHAVPLQYQRANTEAMAVLRWIRHLAATIDTE